MLTLDGQHAENERFQRALAAAVAAGKPPEGPWVSFLSAWPEYFDDPGDNRDAVPSRGADMSAFSWEKPTEESYEKDLDALLAAGGRVLVPETPAAPAPAPAPSTEWL